MIIYNASQLLTLAGGPQRGQELGRLQIIPNGAVVIRGETIHAVGPSDELMASFPNEPAVDADHKVILPGFIDAHTHLIWAGDRAAEFEMQIQGKPIPETSLDNNFGLLHIIRSTRAASFDDLLSETRPRLWSMFSFGTTTAEAKSGYGLRTATELRMLQALLALDAEGPMELIPTFMGAHAIAPEYKDQPEAYIDLVCNTMLPMLQDWWPHHAPFHPVPFVDVACEMGAFNLEQSRRVLEKARELGFPLKLHAGEVDTLGGARLAVEMGATSADYLLCIQPGDVALLANSDTVAVAMPLTSFGKAENCFAPVQELIAANGLVALASGLNPGNAWCENMQFVLAVACRYFHITPAQAIAAATINAAAAVGQAHRLGSLEPDKQADLLILTVSDYRHLGYRFGANLVQTVVKKGRIYPV